jgi:hypothetical protein
VIQSFSSKPLYDDTGTWTLADYAELARDERLERPVDAAGRPGQCRFGGGRPQGRGGERGHGRPPVATSRRPLQALTYGIVAVLVLAPIVPIVIQSFSSKPLYDPRAGAVSEVMAARRSRRRASNARRSR